MLALPQRLCENLPPMRTEGRLRTIHRSIGRLIMRPPTAHPCALPLLLNRTIKPPTESLRRVENIFIALTVPLTRLITRPLQDANHLNMPAGPPATSVLHQPDHHHHLTTTQRWSVGSRSAPVAQMDMHSRQINTRLRQQQPLQRQARPTGVLSNSQRTLKNQTPIPPGRSSNLRFQLILCERQSTTNHPVAARTREDMHLVHLPDTALRPAQIKGEQSPLHNL